ncbi:hypothetical protein KUCAC02_035743 [Chaenocephalus aceratus]|nr:hypothetical protein KUCAC02_035743 [Chaenocephalus aceratus]
MVLTASPVLIRNTNVPVRSIRCSGTYANRAAIPEARGFKSHNGSSNEADIHHKAMQRHRLLTFVYHKGFQVILHEVFTAARCALTQMAAEICGHALTFKCSDISLRRVFSAAAHTAERPPERQSSDDCLGQNVRVRRHRNISPCADPAIRK